MKFSIVIPAYNEERSVLDILRRSLASAERIRAAGLGVDAVEVLLINDGSTDRTEELARGIHGIRVIGFDRNRGYGAAIKSGFGAANGELLGFLDADGTCDPDFFVSLLRLLQERRLDVACGSRMHPDSKMPVLRRAGNRVFRALVNFIGDASVTDVASGMRVLRRSALDRLYPLPDGLNFTPAMSVRAVLDGRLRMGELPMPYDERVGRSKLNVLKDGLRFLGIILDTAVTYRPLLFFGLAAQGVALFAVFTLALACGGPDAPLAFYLKHRRVEDWMIFRLILVVWLLAMAAFLAALGVTAQSLVGIVNREQAPRPWDGWLRGALTRGFVSLGALSFSVAVFLNWDLLHVYWRTGHIPPHYWVLALVGSLFALVGAQYVAFGLMGRVARLLRERELARGDGRSGN